jgi:hypothetical protein
VRAVAGQLIRSVSITGPANGLADVSQIRLGGVAVVPEPSSLACAGWASRWRPAWRCGAVVRRPIVA